MFEARTTQELVQIAAAGGGFEIRVGPRRTQELVQIAAAASQNGAKVYFRGLAARTTQELVQIAAAGRGSVVFADALPGD